MKLYGLLGTETISFRGPEIWRNITKDIKASTTLYQFKRKIKSWKAIEILFKSEKSDFETRIFLTLRVTRKNPTNV